MDAYRELLDPNVIGYPPSKWPEPGPFVGRDVLLAQFLRQRDAFNIDSAELIGEFIDDDDRVVVRFMWRGSGGGPESNMEMSGIYTMRNGKNVAQQFFWDHGEALQAAGLSE
jgi:hypothetical protein